MYKHEYYFGSRNYKLSDFQLFCRSFCSFQLFPAPLKFGISLVLILRFDIFHIHFRSFILPICLLPLRLTSNCLYTETADVHIYRFVIHNRYSFRWISKERVLFHLSCTFFAVWIWFCISVDLDETVREKSKENQNNIRPVYDLLPSKKENSSNENQDSASRIKVDHVSDGSGLRAKGQALSSTKKPDKEPKRAFDNSNSGPGNREPKNIYKYTDQRESHSVASDNASNPALPSEVIHKYSLFSLLFTTSSS